MKLPADYSLFNSSKIYHHGDINLNKSKAETRRNVATGDIPSKVVSSSGSASICFLFHESRNSLVAVSALLVLKTVLQLKAYRKRIGINPWEEAERPSGSWTWKIEREERWKGNARPDCPHKIYRQSAKTEQRVERNTSDWFSLTSINGDLSYCCVVASRGTSRKSVVKVKEGTGFLGNPCCRGTLAGSAKLLGGFTGNLWKIRKKFQEYAVSYKSCDSNFSTGIKKKREKENKLCLSATVQ